MEPKRPFIHINQEMIDPDKYPALSELGAGFWIGKLKDYASGCGNTYQFTLDQVEYQAKCFQEHFKALFNLSMVGLTDEQKGYMAEVVMDELFFEHNKAIIGMMMVSDECKDYLEEYQS